MEKHVKASGRHSHYISDKGRNSIGICYRLPETHNRIIGGYGEARADVEAEVGAVLGDGNVRGVETGRGDETELGDKAVLRAEAQSSDEVGGEAEDEAAHCPRIQGVGGG